MLTAVILCGCIPIYNNVDDIKAEDIESIEIYDLSNCDKPYSGFHNKIDPVYTLDKTLHGEFLDELSEIEFRDTLVRLPIPMDPNFSYDVLTVRINYTNGNFRLISCDGYGETYNKSGEVIDFDHYGCDNDEWRGFIEKYLPDETFNVSKL